MSEQQIQSKIIKRLEGNGFYVLKLIKTNKNGIPDLIAIHPTKPAFLIEVKKPGGKVSELQKFRIKELSDFGIKTEVLFSEKDVCI